ncbi:MAG: transcription antitermination factor NusB [Chromatiales bacterium]|jgi:N utilization substance protein B|nr:transcription antitermination factor NusB [Chromatiales bacterium]
MARRRSGGSAGARTVARRRAMQALYQWQLTGQQGQDIVLQFAAEEEHQKADRDLFRELVREVIDDREALDRDIGEISDRSTDQLDPVEHGILLMAIYELKHRVDVPFRVVINEAVELSRAYGAEDGHKFVNALLDRAARKYRQREMSERS